MLTASKAICRVLNMTTPLFTYEVYAILLMLNRIQKILKKLKYQIEIIGRYCVYQLVYYLSSALVIPLYY